MRIVAIIVSFLSFPVAFAQVGFHVIVPKEPIVVGEAFQVQFVVEGADQVQSIRPPAFAHCRLVAGPSWYQGSRVTVNGLKKLHNAVYTLEALRAGNIFIGPASVEADGNVYTSAQAQLRVMSRKEAIAGKEAGNDYFLAPGEDPQQKIRRNIFLKVSVDRRSCFVGEPVVATFKLYSRLNSRSDIVKNPGYYGFTVHDIINLSDRQVGVEVVDGRLFDVHTVRKVRLFPLQAGALVIDEMEARNRVEFSRTAVNKKTEQEIVEGMMGFEDEGMLAEGIEIFESDMKTEPVTVDVKPLPSHGRPERFRGAVGSFTIEAALQDKRNGALNEAVYIVTLKGRGNFTQIDAPSPIWPAGIEVFDPVVSDLFSGHSNTLVGERSFSYPFVATREDTLAIPPIQFSFFDPDSGRYRTVETQPVIFSPPARGEIEAMPEDAGHRFHRGQWGWLALLLLAVGVILYVRWRRTAPVPGPFPSVRRATDFVQPLRERLDEPGNWFYPELSRAIWTFFSEKSGLQGSRVSKVQLKEMLERKNAVPVLVEELTTILDTCEQGIFTNVMLQVDREALLDRTQYLLEKFEQLF